MPNHLDMIILFILISYSKNFPYCPYACTTCNVEYGEYSDGEEYENYICTDCIEGYFLRNGDCHKECIENDFGCKTCDVGENRDKCFECKNDYELNYNRIGCHSTFIYCGDKKFYHCYYCDNPYTPKATKCSSCEYHYKLDNNGTCEYDFNYKDGKHIKFNFFIIIFNIIIIFY